MRSLLIALSLCTIALTDSAAARPPRTVSITALGHIVLATDSATDRAYLPPNSGAGLLDELAPFVSATDLTLANLAAPISAHGTPKRGVDGIRRFAFRTPPRYAPLLQTLGLDAVLAANNHVLDFGPTAYDDLLAALDGLHIAPVGLIDTLYTKRIHGVRVAVVGFTQPYRPDFRSHHDLDAASTFLAELAPKHDILIVLVHGGGEGAQARHVSRGKEYAGQEYRGRIVSFARRAVDAGADLVIGFGAHHPRAIELYRGRIIAYSLGNFFTYGPFNLRNPNFLGAALQVTLNRRGELVSGNLLPLRLRYPGVPHLDPKAWAIGFIRRLSRADFPESPLRIADDGTLILPPAHPLDKSAPAQVGARDSH